jgi:hypothetical protein
MEDQFVTYEQALSLKKLGFDMPCLKEFHSKNLITPSTGDESTNTELIELYGDNSVIGAPLKQQVFKWFRDKHQLDGWAVPYYSSNEKLYSFLIENGIEENLKDSDEDYKTHEEAESACIDKLIELIK